MPQRIACLVFIALLAAGTGVYAQEPGTSIPMTSPTPAQVQPSIIGAPETISAASADTSGGFLGFPGKVEYHRAAGWTATGLLFAAGVVGAVRGIDLMTRGHEQRDLLGIGEEDSAATASALSSVWSGNQALRWVHVGLLAAGETLYLGQAVTGLSMKLPTDSRSVNADIHLYSFFTHAALMVSEVILGVLTSDALRRGDHEAHLGLVTAHIAVGIAIPVVMAGAGWAVEADLSGLAKP
ncbi:MAG: hypothetical protein WBH97_08475 [Rectinemataceae bacterium]